MFCEAANYYKKQGKTLIDVLNELMVKHGYYLDTQSNAFFRGVDGNDRMNALLDGMRKNPITEAAGIKVTSIEDFLLSPPEGFVPSNVLRYNLEDGSFVAIRPSGTEPKCKVYYCVRGEDKANAEAKLAALKEIFDVKA